MQLESMSSQNLIANAPVPLGPYPEPVLALTLLHVDLNESMLTDMKEVTLVNSDPLNQVPAVQIRAGVQKRRSDMGLCGSAVKRRLVSHCDC